MTTLIGRAAACLGTGTRDPELLGSAIAPFDIVSIAMMADVNSAQCQRRHVRGGALMRSREVRHSPGTVQSDARDGYARPSNIRGHPCPKIEIGRYFELIGSLRFNPSQSGITSSISSADDRSDDENDEEDRTYSDREDDLVSL